MDTKHYAVKESKKNLRERLEEEERANGGYENWYKKLETFRDSLTPYILKNFRRKKFCTNMVTTAGGDRIDHHIVSYFAPLEYWRIGWNGKRRTASEQINCFGEYMKKHGSRFIYVALPNKGVIYPEIISREKCQMPGGNCPQYRKMLKEILGRPSENS